MLTDTHCHLYLEQFAGDVDEVIQRAEQAGVEKMLVPGMDLQSSHAAVKLAELHENIFAAVGFHPTEIDKMSLEGFDELCKLAEHPKVVAVGEIGLDYYWVKEPDHRHSQRHNLIAQLELATAVNKPVVLHLREENDAEFGEATNDLFDILKDWHRKLLSLNHTIRLNPGVFHSFNGNLDSALRAIDMEYQIGITGPVTYKRSESQRDMIRQLPLDRILIETDSPFQTPVPHRGKRNEPCFVVHVADKIGEVHRTTREAVALITTMNANRVFRWEAHT